MSYSCYASAQTKTWADTPVKLRQAEPERGGRMRTTLIAVAITVGALLGGSVALADDTGYHPNGNSCDAGHGAFGAFAHHDAFDNGGVNWRSVDAREDGGLGHDTGPTNSGFSAFCNSQP